MPEYIDTFKALPSATRQGEATRMREKYPGRSCIIVDKADNTDAPKIDKHKFLVPDDITMGQFVYVIRKRLKIHSEKAIFVFVNNKLPPSSMLMSEIYTNYRSDDGFVYMIYSAENTFG
tara:strand:+ start:3445 stop:3801 length:357 start_codon:yes stop_codon:yes gene_type:complete